MDLFGQPDSHENEPEDTNLEIPLETLTPPVEIIGHHTVHNDLLAALIQQRLAHGLIFSGSKGIGKFSLAKEFAKFLLKYGHEPSKINPQTPDFLIPPHDQVAKLVAAGAHPDLLLIEPAYDAAKDQFKDALSVADIRRIAPFLRMTASFAHGWRIVIINEADTMNRNAQNALLKILEEPPEKTVLILITHKIGLMIPTIRSRCRVVQFQPLSFNDFSKILRDKNHDTDPFTLQILYKISEGRVGDALRFLEYEGLGVLHSILKIIEAHPHFSWPELHMFSEQIARSGQSESYEYFAFLLPWIYKQLISAKARQTGLDPIFSDHIERLEKILHEYSLADLIQISESLEELFQKTEHANLDKRQAVLGAFSLLAA